MNQADEELNTLVLNKESHGRKNLALGIYIHVPFVPPPVIFVRFLSGKTKQKRNRILFSRIEG